MMMKKTTALLLALLLALSLTACGKDTADADTASGQVSGADASEENASQDASSVSEDADASAVSDDATAQTEHEQATGTTAPADIAADTTPAVTPATAAVPADTSPAIQTIPAATAPMQAIPTAIPSSSANVDTLPANAPALYVTVSNATPAPGETVEVAVHLRNATLMTSINCILSFDAAKLSVGECNTQNIPSLMDSVSTGNSFINYGALTMNTIDIADSVLYTAEMTVASTASGAIALTLQPTAYDVGTDADGASIIKAVGQLYVVNTQLQVG